MNQIDVLVSNVVYLGADFRLGAQIRGNHPDSSLVLVTTGDRVQWKSQDGSGELEEIRFPASFDPDNYASFHAVILHPNAYIESHILDFLKWTKLGQWTAESQYFRQLAHVKAILFGQR